MLAPRGLKKRFGRRAVQCKAGESDAAALTPASENMDADKFRWYRQAEIKHGRVAMLAIAGLLNQGLWSFGAVELASYEGGLGLKPSDFDGTPNGVAALLGDDGAGPYLGLVVILAGILELRLSDDGREPGNFGDPAGLLSASGSVAAYDTAWRNMEINNGRLAMFGIIGALSAEYVTGMDTYAQWNAAAEAAGQ